MGKPDPRKLERKRRQAREHAKPQRRAEPPLPQACHANKYKPAEHLEPMFCTERGIYRAFVASGRVLCDLDVRNALEGLIGDLHQGDLTAAMATSDDLVSQMIRSSWEEMPDLPPPDDRVGLLRTILGSIEVWSTPRANSRGYLSYLEGFMRKAGVRCEAQRSDEEAAEPPDSDLLKIGRTWCAGEEGAGTVFRALADQMVSDGQADQVADTCQQLIGERPPTGIFRQLSAMAIEARRGFWRLMGVRELGIGD